MIPVGLTVTLGDVHGCSQIHLTSEGTSLRETDQLAQGHTVSGRVRMTIAPMMYTHWASPRPDRQKHRGPGVLASCPLGTPRIFLSISVSFWEAEAAGVPKMCFCPILKKESSVFTTETAFLLTWAFLGQVF